MPLLALQPSVDTSSRASTSSRRFGVLITAAAALLILWKIPSLMQGRIWAEDGLFLIDALHLPWWQALVTPHTGYLDVLASGAMLLATHVTDLEHVPLVSIGIALIVQICPVILLLTSRCDWLRPRWMLPIAILLVVTPPVSEEIWLSPVTSQYHLMLCTGLILAFRVGTGVVGMFQLALLGIASLTGPGPALIAPLFIARAVLDRSRPRALQAAVLSVGALIEIAVFCTHPIAERNLGISPSLLLSVIYMKHLLLPFLGPHLASAVGSGAAGAGLVARTSLLPPVLALVAIIGLVAAAGTSGAREVWWLCATALMTMVLSYFGAFGSQTSLLQIHFGQRYYYTPQVLVALTLLGIAATGTGARRLFGMVLVGWLLITGISAYRSVNKGMAQGPSWREQVALWRAQNDHPVALWPPSFRIVP